MKSIRMTLARWSHLRLFASTLLGAAFLSACDGENLFDPTENPYNDLQVTLSGANGGVAGDTLRFLVTGAGPNGLNRFDVAVRGAVNKDTSLIVANTGRQVSGTVKLVLPQQLIDTLLYVWARGYDANGNSSNVASDTFVVFEPPTIASLTGGESLAPGGVATLRVRAMGLRPLDQMTFVTQGAVPFSNHTVALNPATDVTRDFQISIPSTPADTLVQVAVSVRDVNGLTASRSYTLPIRVTGPEVTGLTVPPEATPGLSLTVEVNGAAMRGVGALKVVLSGSLSDTAEVKRTDYPPTAFGRFTFPLPSDLIGSTITVDAYAIDKSGTVSTPITAYVVLANGDPVVDSLQVSGTVPLGGTLDVRAFSHGPRPLKDLKIKVRGGASATLGPIAITPSQTSATTDVFIPIGAVVSPPETWTCAATTCTTTATVEVSVSDQAGRVSPWTTPITFTITNIPKPADPDAP
jgi:hypothetical protein